MKEFPKVFISHSSQNIEIVQHFCSALTSIGIDAQNVFCSSISGQGVNNGQKLNDAIFTAIESSDLLIYFISYDFINSPYCVEELGVGWYRAQKGEVECYFLLIPDVAFSEIGGFINSKIDKFTLIAETHKADFGVLLENICEKYSLAMPEHSTFLNIERIFFDAVRGPVEHAQNKREEQKQDQLQSNAREKVLSERITSLEEMLKLNQDRKKQEIEDAKIEKLKIEQESIRQRFRYLGFRNGISKEAYKSLYKEFFLSMAERYIELDNLFHREDPEMEMLLACIFSHEGEHDEAYEHLVKYVSLYNTGIYPSFFENVEITKDNDMSEIVSILEERAKKERPGVVLDSYKETIAALKNRQSKIVR